MLSGTRSWIAGAIVDRLDAGDHVVHLLDVQAAHLGAGGAPLDYQAVRDVEPGHPA